MPQKPKRKNGLAPPNLFEQTFGQSLPDYQGNTDAENKLALDAMFDVATRDVMPIQQGVNVAMGEGQLGDYIDLALEVLPFDDIIRMLPLAGALRFIPTGYRPLGRAGLDATGAFVDDATGKIVADMGTRVDSTGLAWMEVGGPGGNTQGTSNTREMLQRFVEAFPQVTKVGGDRVTGVRRRRGSGQTTVPVSKALRRRAERSLAEDPIAAQRLATDLERARSSSYELAQDAMDAAAIVSRNGDRADVWLRQWLDADNEVRDTMIDQVFRPADDPILSRISRGTRPEVAYAARNNIHMADPDPFPVEAPDHFYSNPEPVTINTRPEVAYAAVYNATPFGVDSTGRAMTRAPALDDSFDILNELGTPGRLAPNGDGHVVDVMTGRLYRATDEQLSAVSQSWRDWTNWNRQ